MVPLRPAALFRSRWSALLWAAGVLWFATDVADFSGHAPAGNASAENSSTAAANDSADAASLEALQAQVHAFENMR